MEAYFKKMEKKFSEVGTNILQRITSPWFFTFIPWWVVFNYDFLLIMLGKIQVVYAINQHYCTVGSTRYTIAGCIPQISIGFWHWVFYTPWVTKLALPIITTIFSMTAVACGIAKLADIYESIIAHDFLWRMQDVEKRKTRYKEHNAEIQKELDRKNKLTDTLGTDSNKNKDILSVILSAEQDREKLVAMLKNIEECHDEIDKIKKMCILKKIFYIK
jgi:hypothetical protein